MNMPLHLITGHKGEAHISSADMGAFNAGIFGKGEFVFELGRMFEIEVVSNNLVKIYDGDLMMQGRHISLKNGSYEELTIENGTADMNRIDLIVARYRQDIATGIESAEFAVIKGTATAGEATAPEYTTGDILSGGCVLHEMPLYKIPISGLTIGEPEKVFTVSGAVAKAGDTMTGTLNLKRIFGETAETGGIFPSAYTIGSDRTFALTRFVDGITESMLFFNKNGLGLFDAINGDYSYFSRMGKGTYTGDGTASYFVDLGFTPSAVLVLSMRGSVSYFGGGNYGDYYHYGGLALNGYPCKSSVHSLNVVEIVDGGFNVFNQTKDTGDHGDIVATNNKSLYYYLAWR